METQELTQEQAEAIVQLQMLGDMLDGYLVMGKHYEADRAEDDYLEITSEELQQLADGEFTVLQLWERQTSSEGLNHINILDDVSSLLVKKYGAEISMVQERFLDADDQASADFKIDGQDFAVVVSQGSDEE